MAYNRLPRKDPRTIAREIPGIFDVIFPQLTPGIVSSFNEKAVYCTTLNPIPDTLIKSSTLQQAMLFEIAFARGEQLLKNNNNIDWDDCLKIAVKRQKRHFDAQIPEKLLPIDIKIAELVADNLIAILLGMKSKIPEHHLVYSPEIPGYQWLASGRGDFSLGQTIIEVKCTGRKFGSADYRQVLMYWLLSYASAIEHNTPEWTHIALINPRHKSIVELSVNEIIEIVAAGKSKIEILELFSSMIDDVSLRTLPEFKF